MAPFSTNINSHEYPVRPDLQSKSCLVGQLLVPNLPQSSVSSSLDLVDIFLILPPFLLLQPLLFLSSVSISPFSFLQNTILLLLLRKCISFELGKVTLFNLGNNKSLEQQIAVCQKNNALFKTSRTCFGSLNS